ncbi:GtrA family protein [Cellulomonas aerilata]|uniref:GtrA/DPMS transmembrane domain-containing protein n=1 Tax=Cellulomonas aerilata TaxID=515326 RepID=A0A512DH77_9CELL|nr:GtrA family protein [Cellulomonas aerilata]GEO35796.1 hypothetical protein CAE01nite_35210 [Cellulomonas aerilata]
MRPRDLRRDASTAPPGAAALPVAPASGSPSDPAPPAGPAGRGAPWWRHPLVHYLVIGGLSFVVDMGSLLLLSGPAGLPVWLAATVGYWASLLVNFGLNRRSMAGTGGRLRVQSVRYAVLLVGNFLMTLLVLQVGAGLGLPTAAAKCVAVVVATASNYVLYRRWVFA